MHSRQQLDFAAVIQRSSAANHQTRSSASSFLLLMRWILPGFVFTVGALRPVVAQDDSYREQRSPEARAKMDAYLKKVRSIEFGREQIRDAPAGSFVELEFGDLPKKLKDHMYDRLTTLFQPEVHPQQRKARIQPDPSSSTLPDPAAAARNHPALQPGRMAVRGFAAQDANQSDLIEYRWEHEGVHVRVLFARNAVRMDLDLAEVEKNAQAEGISTIAYLRQLLPRLIRLEGEMHTVPPHTYKAELPLPDTLEEGVQFSTNPDQILSAMDLYFWYKRIDGFVESGKLALLFYTKPGQLGNFQDCAKWFPDDFRALVHQKAREQGKLPPVDPAPEK